MTPKNAQQYLTWLYVGKIELVATTLATPGGPWPGENLHAIQFVTEVCQRRIKARRRKRRKKKEKRKKYKQVI